MTTPGRFIVLEGIDGCGKTTQLQALREWLSTSGQMPFGAELVTTREPGGTALGEALRNLLLHSLGIDKPVPMAELLLYAADRAQHVATVIRPAIEAGHWVLCDRFTGSTAAYQDYGRGIDIDTICALDRMVAYGLKPDLTLWLDVSLTESYRRRLHGGQPADRIEEERPEFLARVAGGFRALAAERNWVRIDADQSVRQVSKACREAIQTLIESQP